MAQKMTTTYRSHRGLGGLRITATLSLAIAMMTATGCALQRQPDDPNYQNNAEPATSDTSQRLEDGWGPGEVVALMTGTVSSKDRNLAFNIPLASWYVRDEHQKGVGLLGGALAYDMISTTWDRGVPVGRRLTSHGLLGIAGHIDERRLDGTGYAEHHWFFPFYRYHNRNGQRVVYPLFIFPVHLEDDPNPPSLDTAPWETAHGENLNPPEVRPVRSESVVQRPGPAPVSDSPEARSLPPREPTLRSSVTPSSGSSELSDTVQGGWRPTSEPGRSRVADDNPLRSSGQPVPASTARTYTVRRGDTLYGIARREYGDASQWRRIRDAQGNPIRDPRSLTVGTRIQLP